MSDTPKCLRPGCPRPPKHRGLCRNCYSCASRLVTKGKTTWDLLIATGKALDAKHPGYNSSHHVQDWFLAPVQNQSPTQ